MVELGNPFSQPYQDLIASLEQSLREGVEQPVTERIIFQSSVSSYDLRYPAVTILRVSGLVGGRNFTIFQPDVHFRLANNRIVWLHATEKPLDGGRLEVEYTYRERPAGLTDFNPGSVVGTLVRAVARELKLLYEQMDQAYRRAFIDEASGAGLDNVVALLGVTRNPAIKAQGEVTFFLKAATTRNIPVRAGTRVEDAAKRAYVTTADGQIEPVITETSSLVDGAVTVKNQIASKKNVPEIEGIWRKLPNSEQVSGDPLVTAATPGLALSEDKRNLLLGGAAPEVRAALAGAGSLLVRYKSISVTVPVEAVAAGPDGNVNSGAVVIMPTPPPGVDGVVNETPITGGQDPENDDQLRDRAKHALERKGNATLNAIKFAVLDVDGVDGVEVVDNSVDSSIPLGEVRVRYSGGSGNAAATDAAVQQVVEQTRAAGILARLEKINEILVSGVVYVLAAPPTPDTAVGTLHDLVVDALGALAIGQPLSLRRLGALVYQVNGLAEVAEVQLRYRKADLNNPGAFLTGVVTDSFLPAQTELVQARHGEPGGGRADPAVRGAARRHEDGCRREPAGCCGPGSALCRLCRGSQRDAAGKAGERAGPAAGGCRALYPHGDVCRQQRVYHEHQPGGRAAAAHGGGRRARHQRADPGDGRAGGVWGHPGGQHDGRFLAGCGTRTGGGAGSRGAHP